MEEEEVQGIEEPDMYRWTSNAAGLSFSVPAVALTSALSSSRNDVTQVRARDLPRSSCDVINCGKERKYRLVKNWKRGACGMEHLKILESTI